MSNMYGRQVVVPMTNKSGGAVVAGDVVVIDTANDTAFTTTTSARVEVTLGVAQEAIASNATGRVLIAGYAALVNVPASVTRGHYVETHTVAKQATGNSTRRSGSFGQFLTGGTTPAAMLWGSTDQTASAGAGLTHAYVGYNTVGGSTEALVDLRQYYKKVTLASACMIESIGVYIKQVTAGHVIGMAVGVLQDTAGTPDSVLAYNNNGASSSFLSTNNGAAGAARWVQMPIGLYAPAGDYWLAVCLTATAAGHQVYYDGSGSDKYHLNGALRITDSGWTTVTTSSNKYSIRASTIA